MFISNTIYNRKQPKCTLKDKQRRCGVHTHTHTHTHTHISIYIETLVSNKKNGIMPFAATWIDLEFIILSKESQK